MQGDVRIIKWPNGDWKAYDSNKKKKCTPYEMVINTQGISQALKDQDIPVGPGVVVHQLGQPSLYQTGQAFLTTRLVQARERGTSRVLCQP